MHSPYESPFMTLDRQSNHPSARSYVLKLHRDALPEQTQLAGRVENMATGRWFEFRSGAELLAHLANDVAAMQGASPGTERNDKA
jgi:hypothetical protein